MKRKSLCMILAAATACLLFTGCAGVQEAAQGAAPEGGNTEVTDEERGAEVGKLIDNIYQPTWTPETKDRCAQAKEAWDALTDAQKELVTGVNADPDYFGADTGDASKDDPLNADGIGEKEILVVSFGTSFNDSRAQDIGGVEKAIAAAFPDWSVRRAFTSQIIMNHVLARDGEEIDNVEQALERAVSNGVKTLVIQPTHLIHGKEYDELIESAKAHAGSFESISVAEPLLGETGRDELVTNDDKRAVAENLVEVACKEAGYASLKDSQDDGTAFVFMGHGTSHAAKINYAQMATMTAKLGYRNVFIGTVEGRPESTACENVIEQVKALGSKKVVLRPLMVVAGDHANNDMAGDDEDSWKSMFEASGAFDSVTCQISGLGRIEAVQKQYIAHTQAAIDNPTGVDGGAADQSAAALKDGVYEAAFTTDSSMFKVNETKNGMGELTVKNGEMMIHISLPSENIVNLYPGLAEDAQKEGAVLLEPTKDEVTYSDGSTETVNGFDIPVPVLDEEFDLALIGTKGKWYDHKVVVASPAA